MGIVQKFIDSGNKCPDDIDELYELVSVLYKAYRTDQPLVPDNVYDQLESKLLHVKPNAMKQIDEELASETYRQSIRLPHEMLGITQLNDVAANAYDTNAKISQFIKATKTKQLVITDKLDGCSVMLQYINGKFTRAFSKHSGEDGLDITRHVSLLNIPRTIEIPGEVYVRGEAIIPKRVFESQWGATYANPRNFVAGKLNSKFPDVEAMSDIHFVAYTLCDSTENRLKQLEILARHNFEVVPHKSIVDITQVDKGTLDQIVNDAKASSIYELDGIVIDPVMPKYDGSMARKYKVISETAQTKVVGVEWNLRKDGDFRPVVLLEPVNIGGVSISRASGFNAFYIKHGRLSTETNKPDHPIGPGAVVTIIRSGDVIPDIQSVDVPAASPSLPSEIEWGEMEWSDSGIHLRIKNVNHPSVKLGTITYFFNTMDVDGFRETTIKKILATFPHYEVADIYGMEVSDFVRSGFGDNQALALRSHLENSMISVNMPKFMAATNFFGKLWATERCMKVWKSVDGDLTKFNKMTIPQVYSYISGMDGFGESTATTFASNIHRFNEYVNKVGHIFTFENTTETEPVGDVLKDFVVVFTGFRDDSLEELIEKNGGKMGTWTSPTHIVTKDTAVMRPKIQKAIDKGAKFMSKSEFVADLQKLGVDI